MNGASLPAIVTLAMALGDDALILSERTSELIMRAPTLEEELAVANISLDLLGQARNWLTLAGEKEGCGRDENALAYQREPADFRHCHIVELPNDDFAFTVLRLLMTSAYSTLLLKRLSQSSEPDVAAIAAKSHKESVYHLNHTRMWVDVLTHGTEESMQRLTEAAHTLSSYVDELLDVSWIPDELIADGTCPAMDSIAADWRAIISSTLAETDLVVPESRWNSKGGRSGQFSEHLLEVLTRLQSVHRAHPGATW